MHPADTFALCAYLCEGRLRPMWAVVLNELAIETQQPGCSEEVDVALLSRPWAQA